MPRQRLPKRAILILPLIAVAALFLLLRKPEQPPLPLPDAALLREGDWIFRSGTSADSRLIKTLSRSPYSHIGMLVAVRPQPIVAHATTDDDPERPNQVLLTPLADFAAADRADGIAVARARFLTPEQARAAARQAKTQAGRAFVLTARHQNPFYCTTLIADAVHSQHPAFSPQWQHLDIALYRGDYLFPEAFAHENIEWIYRVSAKP